MLVASVRELRPTVFTPSLKVARAPVLRVLTEREETVFSFDDLVVFCYERATPRDTVARFVFAFSSIVVSVVFFVGIVRDIEEVAAQDMAV